MVASAKHEGILWVINDSGNPPELFAITYAGEVRGAFKVDGAIAFDWEGLGYHGGNLYIADTGDNLHIRPNGVVYVVPEPDVLVENGALYVSKAIDLAYPNGSENVEAFAVDPLDGSLVFSTRGDQGGATLYRKSGDRFERVGHFDFSDGSRGSDLTTSADFDGASSRFLLRTYVSAYFWARAPGTSWTAAFAYAPCQIALEKDRQGEAITFVKDGFITLSEGVGQPIRHYTFTP